MRQPGHVDCDEHGRSPYALICRHLREGEQVDYFAAPACEHGPAEAWCAECDARVAEQQGWTDAVEKEADKALYCAECYKRALRKHRFVAYVQGSDDPCEWDLSVAPDE
jgi:hypothetical protein